MQFKFFNVYFFFIIFAGIGILTYFIFQPFLSAIIMAAILATLFKSTYNTLEAWTRGYRGLSAFLTCLLIFFIIITPIMIVLSLVISEINTFYQALGNGSSFEEMMNHILFRAQSVPYVTMLFDTSHWTQARILDDVKQLSQQTLGLLQVAYQSIADFIFWIFILFFALFYFLIDGKQMLKHIIQMSPLRDAHDQLLIKKFISISRATLKGTLLVGLVQGILGGIAFLIVGIPSPALWGLVMVLVSIIPLVGAALVWVPAALILLLMGNIWQGIFMLVFGAGIISMIDNILRPRLVGKDTQMHPLMVFFATLGGLSLFGIAGFIIGPIVVALLLALSEIYELEFRSQLKEYNE
ncbi:MAG: AI-2E family transporter [Minisyncoccota bacterium]